MLLEWICLTCSFNEQQALKTFQKQGIKDPLALSVVMASVKQESKFIPNICEGGARVQYNQCHRGGYGIIQWTTKARYDGLGKFCRKYECDPSTLSGQLRYLTNESQWRSVLPVLKLENRTFSTYYNATYRWLGWGISGPRKRYAYDYLKRLSKNENVNNAKQTSAGSTTSVETTDGNRIEQLGFFDKLLWTVGIKG